jgi:hypothetical protein
MDLMLPTVIWLVGLALCFDDTLVGAQAYPDDPRKERPVALRPGAGSVLAGSPL